ncbi:MAG: STAS domain-containing protein [Solirubrobacteraceae bacterium]
MAAATETDFDDPLLAGLSIVVSQQDATTTIALDGEWDLAQQEKTREAVQSALARQPDRVVLDLSRLTFMDLTGVHDVLELANQAARLKVDLVVVRGPRAVQRLFELCQLSEFLTCVDIA